MPRFLPHRRDFLKMASVSAAGGYLAAQQPQSFVGPAASEDSAKTDFTLRISPVTLELAPNRVLSTIGYNGASPGPRLRMKEGAPELEFRQRFTWLPPSVKVVVDFSADEAVEHYWIGNVSTCPCAH